ncbi:MAG: hypothetical protein WCY71_12370 [Halothiobacillaceae bacterium]
MRDTIIKWAFWIAMAGVLLWSFDSGMKKQQEIDCAHGRYCNV